jgi:hypothetical protein
VKVRAVVAVAALVASISGCGVQVPSRATAPPSALPAPAASAAPVAPTSPQPAVAAGDPHVATARRLIAALTGVEPTAPARIGTTADPDTGQTRTTVEIGGWDFEWDAAGPIAFAGDLDAAAIGPAVDRATATARMERAAALVAGSAPDGPPQVRQEDPDQGDGWDGVWNRVESGVPVRGDGVFVMLTSDGGFSAWSRTWHALAARPTTVLSRDQAIAAFRRAAGAAAGRLGALRSASLTWARGGVGPSPEVVLGWLLEFAGADVSQPSASEVFLDAATGRQLWAGDASGGASG